MYIGQTGDVTVDLIELPKHFHYVDCSFETDLPLSILEKVQEYEYL